MPGITVDIRTANKPGDESLPVRPDNIAALAEIDSFRAST